MDPYSCAHSITLRWFAPTWICLNHVAGFQTVHDWDIQNYSWAVRFFPNISFSSALLCATLCCTRQHMITKTQNNENNRCWVWRGPLEIIWSNAPAQAGSARAGCPAPCPAGFRVSPLMEAPQPLWDLFQCLMTHSKNKNKTSNFFLRSDGFWLFF